MNNAFQNIKDKFYTLTSVLVWEIDLEENDTITLKSVKLICVNKLAKLQLNHSYDDGFAYTIDKTNKKQIKSLSQSHASIILLSGKGIIHDEINSKMIDKEVILDHLSGGINTTDFIGLGLNNKEDVWSSFLVRQQSIKSIEEKFNIAYLVSVYFKGQIKHRLFENFNDPLDSAGFQFLNYYCDEISFDYSQFNSNTQEVISKNIFTKILKFGALLFAIIYFTNELIVNSLIDRYAEVELAAQMEQGNRKLYETLKLKVRQQKDLIAVTGANSIYPLSWVGDRILYSLPRAIKLKSIEINPLKLNLSKSETNISANTINVIGYTPTSLELDNWTQKLKSNDFIKSVLVVSFSKGLVGKSSQFKLIIEIV